MDNSDLAQAFTECERRAQIEAVKSRKRELTPEGQCHFCAEEFDNLEKLFCDAECGREYEKAKRGGR